MKMNKNTGLAFLLIAFGILVLLGKLGPGLGWLMSWIVPAGMVFLGYLGLRNGRTVIGTILMAIGLLVLLGKFAGLLWYLFPVIIIGIGVYLLTNKKSGAY